MIDIHDPGEDFPGVLYPQVAAIGWDVQPNGCWLWRGKRNQKQYGRYRKAGAHRIVFAYHNGGLDPNLVVRHTCDNPLCVNPDHLLSGTHADNMRDKVDRGRHYQQKKTHCPAGHPLVEGNLRRRDKGWRDCLTCRREADRTTRSLVRDASIVLGMTQRAYIADYGRSTDKAAAIIADLALSGSL
jgi:hypothetical protein